MRLLIHRAGALATIGVILLQALPSTVDAQNDPTVRAPESKPTVRLVRDLLDEQGPNHLIYPAGVIDFVRLDDAILFRGWDGIHGWELWSTDGGLEGTRRVKDLCPGVCSSLPFEMRLISGYVYFQASDGDHGGAIWRTDGSEMGTQVVANIPEGTNGFRNASYSPFLTEFQSSIYFVADDGVHGSELWRSDGAPGGVSELVADIRPGPEGSEPASLLVFGAELFFTADDGIAGRELWKSDGTDSGTILVKDVCQGPEGCFWQEQISPPAGSWVLAEAQGRLVFKAGSTYGSNSDQLWTSDGTPAGTTQIGDLNIERILSYRTSDGAVLLSAEGGAEGHELWRTDGTTQGTYLLKDINTSPSGDSSPFAWGVSDGVVYLSATDSSHGTELWRTDGTSEGTFLVKDIQSGPDSGMRGSFVSLVPHETSGFVYFPADDGVHGLEMWRSDGTDNGTLLLGDLNPGPAASLNPWEFPIFPTEISGQLVFYALDELARWRLWTTDGTPSGTTLTAEIDEQASAMERAGRFHQPQIAVGGDRVLFSADDGFSGIELWGTDGSFHGTELVKDTCPPGCEQDYGGGPVDPVAVEESVYFVAFSEGESRVWITDGGGDGTNVVDPDLPAGSPWGLTPWIENGSPPRLVFSDGGLYVTEGTAESTRRLTQEAPFETYPEFPTPVAEKVFFSHGFPNEELWVSYGQTEDAEQVAEIAPGETGSGPMQLTRFGRRLIFSADDGTVGREPWISDGTADGTRLLKDIRPGPESSMRESRYGNENLEAEGYVYFAASDGATGEELWVTDGTMEGTRRIADINPGAGPSEPRLWADSKSGIYFSAWTPRYGRELWRADPGGRGVQLVIDLNPGPESGVNDFIRGVLYSGLRDRPVIWKGRLYFAGTNGSSGFELWSTDGTEAGTRLEADIHPGPGASSPNSFTPFRDKLVFGATDGSTGFELWVLEQGTADLTIFEDGFESGDSSAWSGVVP